MNLLRLLLVVLALAGCELPTTPEPSNPFDPAFEGARTATPPSDLRMTGSALTSIALAWTDNSSFETGIRVERATVPDYGYGDPTYETVAVLPADATAYTDTSVDSDGPFRYRLVALVAGGRDSAPSAVLALRYPTERVLLDPAVGPWVRAVRVAPDGEAIYMSTETDVVVVDARTGRLVSRIVGFEGVAGFLTDGRVAVYSTSYYSPARVRFYRGIALESSVTLGSAGCEPSVGAPVVVSADGTRVVAACAFRNAVGAWRVASPGVPVVFALSADGSGFTPFVAGVSPDGRFAVAGSPAETVGLDLDGGGERWRAPVSASYAVLSPDGQSLLARRGAERVAVLDAATGAIRAEADGLLPAAFRADGQTVVHRARDYFSESQIARTSDLAPVFLLAQGFTSSPALTPTGALDLSYENPREIVRWDFGRAWETLAE